TITIVSIVTNVIAFLLIVSIFFFFIFFFFSSRRRHTRSYGDWSSDVCSSDLGSTSIGAPMAPQYDGLDTVSRIWLPPERAGVFRSEERRVGKECRSRWWADC